AFSHLRRAQANNTTKPTSRTRGQTSHPGNASFRISHREILVTSHAHHRRPSRALGNDEPQEANSVSRPRTSDIEYRIVGAIRYGLYLRIRSWAKARSEYRHAPRRARKGISRHRAGAA